MAVERARVMGQLSSFSFLVGGGESSLFLRGDVSLKFFGFNLQLEIFESNFFLPFSAGVLSAKIQKSKISNFFLFVQFTGCCENGY